MPGQFPAIDVGVTVYVTVCIDVKFVEIVLLKGLPDCGVKLSPVVFTLSVAIQV